MSKFLAAFVLALGIGTPLSAATYQFGAGDKDCFGIGGTCADGDLFLRDLGGTIGDDSTADDPAGTDAWAIGPRRFEFKVNTGSDSVVKAMLELFIVGVDLAMGANVFYGDEKVGYIKTKGLYGFQRIGLFLFEVNPARISSLAKVSIFPTDINDGFSVDYVRLNLETEPVSEVPLPGTLPLIGAALVLAGFVRRRRS